MLSRDQILELLKLKTKGQSIHVKTPVCSYWGNLSECDNEKVALKPYYTNKEPQLTLHNVKMELLVNEIIDVD